MSCPLLKVTTISSIEYCDAFTNMIFIPSKSEREYCLSEDFYLNCARYKKNIKRLSKKERGKIFRKGERGNYGKH